MKTERDNLPTKLTSHGSLTKAEKLFFAEFPLQELNREQQQHLLIILEHLLEERVPGYNRVWGGSGKASAMMLCGQLLHQGNGLEELKIQTTANWIADSTQRSVKDYVALFIKLWENRNAYRKGLAMGRALSQGAPARPPVPARDPAAPYPTTTPQQRYDEAVRELQMRQEVYPRWVPQRKLTQQTADLRIEALQDIIADLLRLYPGEIKVNKVARPQDDQTKLPL